MFRQQCVDDGHDGLLVVDVPEKGLEAPVCKYVHISLDGPFFMHFHNSNSLRLQSSGHISVE